MHGHSFSVGCRSLCRAMNCTRKKSSSGVQTTLDFLFGENESCLEEEIVFRLTTRCGDFYDRNMAQLDRLRYKNTVHCFQDKAASSLD